MAFDFIDVIITALEASNGAQPKKLKITCS